MDDGASGGAVEVSGGLGDVVAAVLAADCRDENRLDAGEDRPCLRLAVRCGAPGRLGEVSAGGRAGSDSGGDGDRRMGVIPGYHRQDHQDHRDRGASRGSCRR